MMRNSIQAFNCVMTALVLIAAASNAYACRFPVIYNNMSDLEVAAEAQIIVVARLIESKTNVKGRVDIEILEVIKGVVAGDAKVVSISGFVKPEDPDIIILGCGSEWIPGELKVVALRSAGDGQLEQDWYISGRLNGINSPSLAALREVFSK